MKLNALNLQIAKYCGIPPSPTAKTDVLKIDGTHTTAANCFRMFRVQTLEPDNTPECFVTPGSSVRAAMMFPQGFTFNAGFFNVVDCTGFDSVKVTSKEVAMKAEFDASLFVDTIRTLIEMADDPEVSLQVRFYGLHQPVQFTVMNRKTRQTIDAFMSSRIPTK